MFIGHFAVAFAAKRAAPAVSLGMLFLAAQLADLIWPHLVVVGIERLEVDPGNTAFTPLNFVSYPYSHSLVAMSAWATAAAAIYMWARQAGLWRGLVLAIVAVSHWGLDAISHRPDLPVTIGGDTRVGLGLWNSIPATLIVEGLMLAGGVALYLRATRARDRAGAVGLWSLVGLLVLITIANVAGPPPPSPEAVAWTAHAMWLLVIWGFWVDRHRTAVPT
jgi:hypothetical protein